jgi:hypothetical protein
LPHFQREFGRGRVERVLAQFRAQAIHDGVQPAEAVSESAAFAAALAAETVADLDVAVECGAKTRDDAPSRWSSMLSSLPCFLYQGVLGALDAEYRNEAERVLAAGWSQDWGRWAEFEAYFSACLSQEGEAGLLEEHHLEYVRDTLRAHVRLSVQNKHVEPTSDEARLRELESSGLRRGRGEIHRDADGPANQCLADSLLQLLIRSGFLADTITMPDRQYACQANRRQLVEGPAELRPRERDAFTGEDFGESPRAFLSHDVHAAPTVRFFMEWFAARGLKVRDLPEAGVVLTVRSRFDSEILPASRLVICVGDGSGGGGAAVFQLYNLTGDGVSGMHYDPLFAGAVALC